MTANSANVDKASIAAFGQEWSRFDYARSSKVELVRLFERYFRIFPWKELPIDPVGFDFGCGSGRWARLVAPRAGILHCIDASPKALETAKHSLQDSANCRFHLATAESIPMADDSADFGFSLGVLHHIPDPQHALRACVQKLRIGSPFLLYVYYNFENRPAWFRYIWRGSILPRLFISRLPPIAKLAICEVIAAIVYFPLARLARIFQTSDQPGQSLPLAQYCDSTFYTMRTDALDRFGTPLERRFSRAELREMMLAAGLTNIRFSESAPHWVALGYRAEFPTRSDSSDVAENPTVLPLESSTPIPCHKRAFGVKGWCLALILTIFLMGLQGLGLKSLPYASDVLEHIFERPDSSSQPAPEGSGFQLGSLRWDVHAYSQDPKLQPLRSFYHTNCAARSGISAAVCISDVFAKTFPFGAARHDFCDRTYDPAAVLSFHLSGNPAHCMQRSALLAAVLLSAGIPARVVQILGDRQGHTLVEVWERAQGWIFFDPSTGCVIGRKGAVSSSLAMLRSSRFITAYVIGVASFHPANLASFYEGLGPTTNIRLFYPEPWLYLRTGLRFSVWPFRGRYVTPENLSWRFGLGQRSYEVGIVLLFLIALVCAAAIISAVWLRRKDLLQN